MALSPSNHEDFQTEKTLVEHYLSNRGHVVMFIPKFHCELNPIERVWGQVKVYTRAHTNYTLVRLRQIVDPALDSVSTDLIRKFFRKACDYERVYIEGKAAGKEVEQAMKVLKSHRRIFFWMIYVAIFVRNLFYHNSNRNHFKNNLLYKSVVCSSPLVQYSCLAINAFLQNY